MSSFDNMIVSDPELGELHLHGYIAPENRHLLTRGIARHAGSKAPKVFKSVAKSSGCHPCWGCKPTLLGQCDFKNGPVVLSKSGKYALKSDIEFLPLSEDSSAIVIDSDDVILDLCGNTLSQIGSFNDITGITVVEDHGNVTILGSYGAIRDFTTLGIRVEGGATNVTIGDHTRLEITNCGGGKKTAVGYQGYVVGGIDAGNSAAWVNGGNPAKISYYLTLQNVHCDRNFLAGATINQVFGVDIDGSSFNENTVTIADGLGSAQAEGLYMAGPDGSEVSKDVVITNSKFLENYIDKPVPGVFLNIVDFHFVDGFFPYAIDGLRVENCQFNRNRSIGRGKGVGGGILSCVQFVDCEFCGNSGRAVLGEGIHFSGSAIDFTVPDPVVGNNYDIQFIRCNASDNSLSLLDSTVRTFSSRGASGFSLVFCNNTRLIDCQANRNTVDVTADPTRSTNAAGVLITGSGSEPFKSLDNVIENLQATSQTSNAAGGSVAGVLVRRYIGRTTINGGTFTNNTSTGTVLADGIRLDHNTGVTFDLRDNVVKGALIQRNDHAGIRLRGRQIRFTVEDNNVNDNGAEGILVDDSSADGWVLRNKVSHNGAEGLKDTAGTTSTLFSNNESVKNSGSNYSVTPAPEIVSGTLASFPPAGGALRNVSIT